VPVRYSLSAAKYSARTKASKPTATRDLADLVAHGYLRRLPEGGHITRHELNLDSGLCGGAAGL